MKKLDRNRPIGTIVGVFAEVPKARYTQDGNYFDSNGDMIDGSRKQEEKGQKEILRRDGHVDTSEGQETKEAGAEIEETELLDNPNAMSKTDEELASLAAAGMSALRSYADNFGVKGVSKKEIIEELKALR